MANEPGHFRRDGSRLEEDAAKFVELLHLGWRERVLQPNFTVHVGKDRLGLN